MTRVLLPLVATVCVAAIVLVMFHGPGNDAPSEAPVFPIARSSSQQASSVVEVDEPDEVERRTIATTQPSVAEAKTPTSPGRQADDGPPIYGLSDQAKYNIEERSRTMEQWVDLLDGSSPLPASVTRLSAATNAANLAALMIFDGTERTVFPGAAPEKNEPFSEANYQHYWHLDDSIAKNVSSGGGYYSLPYADFPVLEEIKVLREEYGDGVPTELIPHEAVIRLVEQARSVARRVR